jgi:hypothetical protein
VSIVTRQAIIVGSFGLAFSTLIIILGRQGRLAFRFIVGWLCLGIGAILGAVLMYTVIPVSEALGITTATFGLAVAVIIPIGVAVELSITVSRNQRRIRELAEQLALISNRLDHIEKPRPGSDV